MDSSSEVVPAVADVKRPGGDGIFFVSGGAGLSASSTASISFCLTQIATDAMKPESLTIFSIGACIKLSGRDQLLKLWLSVSSRTPRSTISATALSTNEKAGILNVLGCCAVPCYEEVTTGLPNKISEHVSHFLSLDGLNDILFSTWSRDFSSSLLILMTGKSEFTNMLWI